MSVREEDRNKNSCPSRGLGIAAAAIGVGVGAALYYFFNKRQENPSSEGSSSDWNCERQQTFHVSESDASYTTVSEHDTSDTSMNSSLDSNMSFIEENCVISVECNCEEELSVDERYSPPGSDSELSSDDADISNSFNNSDISVSDIHDIFTHYLGNSDHSSDDSDISNSFNNSDISITDIYTHYLGDSPFSSSFSSNVERLELNTNSDNEWEITSSSLGVPEVASGSPMSSLISIIGRIASPRKIMTEDEQMAILRQQQFRERSWSLEECSICFDVMLRNQDVTSLPCTHNFHTDCIMPWLQEKQTCPNCRKVAE